MPMIQIDGDYWHIGARVHAIRSTNASRRERTSVETGEVTKITKTRVTVTFPNGRTEQYYDRWGSRGGIHESVLTPMGAGQNSYSTVSEYLYREDHPDVHRKLEAARKTAVRQAVERASAALSKDITETSVNAMIQALEAWKSEHVFKDAHLWE